MMSATQRVSSSSRITHVTLDFPLLESGKVLIALLLKQTEYESCLVGFEDIIDLVSGMDTRTGEVTYKQPTEGKNG